MFTIIAFLLSIIGSINWLMIGFFQYDFIAGLFGFQASIFSRFFYLLFGMSAFVLIFKLIKGKGKIVVFSKRNKKDLQENMQTLNNKMTHSPQSNIESENDLLNKTEYKHQHNNYENDQHNQYDDFNENSYDFSNNYYNQRNYNQDNLNDFDKHYRQ